MKPLHCPILIRKTDDSRQPFGRLSRWASSSGVPTDVLQEASDRLGWVALIYAATYFLAYFVSGVPHWIREGTFGKEMRTVGTIVAAVSIVVSVVLFWLTRIVRVHPKKALDLGLIYLVVGSLGISMAEFWHRSELWTPESVEGGHFGLPWECLWIMIYPMFAPHGPLKTLIGLLLAASTAPVVLVISKAAGGYHPDLPLGFFLYYYFPFTTYLCAFLAFFTARGIHKLGSSLRRAREIGSYQLVELLGHGGMGEVWRAEHRMLARPAAVKLIRGHAIAEDTSGGATLLRRFEREAQATAALCSPHTINLFDFGTTDDGTFYYVMELLEGLDLDSLVKQHGPLPPGRVIHLLRQACHSLAEAHQTGLIHRDVKPANIYTCRYGLDVDFVKVLDFGLVKRSPRRGVEATRLTQQGVSFGTPGFMAPEMALGEETIDGRADLYALGCVAYWLLTGALVFEAETPVAMAVAHVKTEPVAPSLRSELSVPEDLDDVVLACLAKDPGDRPQDALELERRLAACTSRSPWATRDSRAWWDLHMPARPTSSLCAAGSADGTRGGRQGQVDERAGLRARTDEV